MLDNSLISNHQKLLQQVSSMMPHFCDKCGHKHDPSDLEVVYNTENKAMCKLGCKNCHNTYIIHVNSPVGGMVSAKRSEFKSEISAKEITKFSEFGNIDSNEIIDVHAAMQDVQTIDDFNKLF